MTQLTLKELEHDVQDFLKFKRAMGYSYIRGELMLTSLQQFARHHLPAGSGRKAKISLEKTAHAWLSRTANRKGNTVAQELTVVRQLCLHRRRRDPLRISRKEGHRFTASRSMVSCHAGPVLMKQDVVDFLSATSIRQESGFLIFHRCNQRLMAIVGCADAVF